MQLRRSVVGLAITFGAAAVVLGVTAFGLSSKGPNNNRLDATVVGTAQTPQGPMKHATLKLATYPDSMAGRARRLRWRASRLGELRPVHQPARARALAGHRDDRPVRRRREDHQPVVRDRCTGPSTER